MIKELFSIMNDNHPKKTKLENLIKEDETLNDEFKKDSGNNFELEAYY